MLRYVKCDELVTGEGAPNVLVEGVQGLGECVCVCVCLWDV